MKFSEKGIIRLSVTMNSREPKGNCELQFCVEDNGIGIPESVQPGIFQPFYQADSSIRRKFGGSGKRIFSEFFIIIIIIIFFYFIRIIDNKYKY